MRNVPELHRVSTLKPFTIEVIYRNVPLSWGDKWTIYKRYLSEARRGQALEQLKHANLDKMIGFRKGK